MVLAMLAGGRWTVAVAKIMRPRNADSVAVQVGAELSEKYVMQWQSLRLPRSSTANKWADIQNV